MIQKTINTFQILVFTFIFLFTGIHVANAATGSCATTQASGCRSESDYANLNTTLMNQGGYLGNSESQKNALKQCRNEIDKYKSCLSSENSGSDYSPSPSTYYSNNIDFDDLRDRSCKEQFGYHAYSTGADKCKCKSGYNFGKNDQCVSSNTFCIQEHGQTAWYDSSSKVCHWCNSGIKENGKCVDKSPISSCPKHAIRASFRCECLPGYTEVFTLEDMVNNTFSSCQWIGDLDPRYGNEDVDTKKYIAPVNAPATAQIKVSESKIIQGVILSTTTPAEIISTTSTFTDLKTGDTVNKTKPTGFFQSIVFKVKSFLQNIFK